MLSKLLLLKIASDLTLDAFHNFCLVNKAHFELYRNKTLWKHKLLHTMPSFNCQANNNSLELQIIDRMFSWLTDHNIGVAKIYRYSTSGNLDSVRLFDAGEIGVFAGNENVARILSTCLVMVIDNNHHLDIDCIETIDNCIANSGDIGGSEINFLFSDLPTVDNKIFELFMTNFPCVSDDEYSIYNFDLSQADKDIIIFDINDIYCGMLKLYERH